MSSKQWARSNQPITVDRTYDAGPCTTRAQPWPTARCMYQRMSPMEGVCRTHAIQALAVSHMQQISRVDQAPDNSWCSLRLVHNSRCNIETAHQPLREPTKHHGAVLNERQVRAPAREAVKDVGRV